MPAKKMKNLVTIDPRGRVTIPVEMRQGSETFVIEQMKDGTIRLIPQAIVNISDAALIRSLKKSAQQAKAGDVEDVPKDWIKS
ncbi:MAG TPA: hypothetical protein VI754_11375 [Bacteriovoracaceae bacterium]|nr:hypothetical protein [Bacteriovoracaceae bacterium]